MMCTAWLLQWMISIKQPGGWLVTIRLWLEVNSQRRFLVSDWIKADPVGWMLPPDGVVRQAGR